MMRNKNISNFLSALVMALVLGTEALAQSPQTRTQDSCESTTLKAQISSGGIDRELMARAEERAESMRAKLFELEIKELDLLALLDELDYRSSPDGIQRALAFVGSARPMDELREGLRIRVEAQKSRVNRQLEQLSSTRVRLEAAIREADAEVERAHRY
jgi:hypothetical protein